MGIDYRYLSFGICSSGAKAVNDTILNVDCRAQVIHIIKKRQPTQTIEFVQLKNFKADPTDEKTLFLQLTNDADPISLTLESELDRDDVIVALTLAKNKKTAMINKKVGLTVKFSGKAKKEGKIGWSSRWLVLVKNRLIIFHKKSDEYPSNVISLSEVMPTKDPHKPIISLQTMYRSSVFKFGKESSQEWLSVLLEQSKESQFRATRRKKKRLEFQQQQRSKALSKTKVSQHGLIEKAMDEDSEEDQEIKEMILAEEEERKKEQAEKKRKKTKPKKMTNKKVVKAAVGFAKIQIIEERAAEKEEVKINEHDANYNVFDEEIEDIFDKEDKKKRKEEKRRLKQERKAAKKRKAAKRKKETKSLSS